MAHVTEKSRYMYLSLGTAWVQSHMMPLVSSLALLSLNWVCFESSCGSQMAAPPPSLVSTLFRDRQRVKQSWSCQCLNTTHDIGLNWVTCPIPELITMAKRMGYSSWLNHSSTWLEKEKGWFLKWDPVPQKEGERQPTGWNRLTLYHSRKNRVYLLILLLQYH